VPPEHYLALYREILDHLDPQLIHDRLLRFGETPVMLCWGLPAIMTNIGANGPPVTCFEHQQNHLAAEPPAEELALGPSQAAR
jgi:hypothetical protein